MVKTTNRQQLMMHEQTRSPDEVSDHVCPVTKDAQQTLLALVLVVLTACRHSTKH